MQKKGHAWRYLSFGGMCVMVFWHVVSSLGAAAKGQQPLGKRPDAIEFEGGTPWRRLCATSTMGMPPLQYCSAGRWAEPAAQRQRAANGAAQAVASTKCPGAGVGRPQLGLCCVEAGGARRRRRRLLVQAQQLCQPFHSLQVGLLDIKFHVIPAGGGGGVVLCVCVCVCCVGCTAVLRQC